MQNLILFAANWGGEPSGNYLQNAPGSALGMTTTSSSVFSDYALVIGLIVFFSIVLMILTIWAIISIINISHDLRDLVDLEYKKFNETRKKSENHKNKRYIPDDVIADN